jgi:hypothetical protein
MPLMNRAHTRRGAAPFTAPLPGAIDPIPPGGPSALTIELSSFSHRVIFQPADPGPGRRFTC